MKKIIFSLLFITVISPVFAQTVKLGISGGLNESILSAKSITGEDDARLAGFHAGIFSDIDFGKVSIAPGLFYTTKGQRINETLYDEYYYDAANSTSSPASIKGHQNTIYSYLEIPVNVLYNMPVKYGKFFIGGGPYFAYALSAKIKDETATSQNGAVEYDNQTTPLTFGGDNGLHRFDFGLGALFGLALKNGLSVNVGFEHGLTNVYKPESGTVENNVYAVSLGYSFL